MLENEFNLEAQQLTKAEKRKRPKDKNSGIRKESASGARAAKLNLSSINGLDSAKELGSSPELGSRRSTRGGRFQLGKKGVRG